MTLRVFVDSNIVFSRTVRDWLFLLRNETRDMFQLHSTVDVIAEAVRATRRSRPSLDGAVTRSLHRALLANFDEVLDDFDATVPFSGSDPHDRHVYAAALAARSDILLTANGRDFGAPDEHPFDILDADTFFTLVDDSAPTAVRRVAVRQRDYWNARARPANPSRSLISTRRGAACPTFALRVELRLGDVDRNTPDT